MDEEKLKQCRIPVHTAITILQRGSKILLVMRRNEQYKGKMVFPGGSLNEGERVEDVAIREVKEETSLDIELDSILGVYSDPDRDPREHRISTVFIGKISDNNDQKEPMAGDDAAALKWVDPVTMDEKSFGFDHKKY